MIQERTLRNGLRLVVERLDAPQSAALSWLVPAGTAGDPPGARGEGASALIAELLLRGASEWDSRAHSEALDRLGVDRRTAPSVHHIAFSATLLGRLLDEALPLLTATVVSPRFEASHLEPAKRLAIQAIEGIEDEPSHLAFMRLTERFFPPPFNRSGLGTREGIAALSIEDLRQQWRTLGVPGGSILSMAGPLDIDAIVVRLEALLEGWSGRATEPKESGPAIGGSLLVPTPSAQAHMALGLWAPPEPAPEALLHRLAVRIFGGETSGRLFTEVREKRGLCYSVGASASMGRDRGITSIYAGSTPDRAEMTLAQIRAEIDRFASGVTAAEFERTTVGFRSRLLMQGESTSARAAAMAIDLHRLGRARSLQELTADVERIDLESLNRYIRGTLAERWSAPPTLVVVGPRPLGDGAAANPVATGAAD